MVNKAKSAPVPEDLSESVERTQVSRLFGQKLVKREFQLRFSLIIFSMFGAVVFLTWLIGRLTVEHMFQMGLVNGEQFLIQINMLNTIIVKSALLGMIIVYGISLTFSHYIAGPIYRLEKVLEELGTGNLDVKFKLRRYDEFSEVAELFNKSIQVIKEKFGKQRRGFDGKINEALAVLENSNIKKKTAEKTELIRILKSVEND